MTKEREVHASYSKSLKQIWQELVQWWKSDIKDLFTSSSEELNQNFKIEILYCLKVLSADKYIVG